MHSHRCESTCEGAASCSMRPRKQSWPIWAIQADPLSCSNCCNCCNCCNSPPTWLLSCTKPCSPAVTYSLDLRDAYRGSMATDCVSK